MVSEVQVFANRLQGMNRNWRRSSPDEYGIKYLQRCCFLVDKARDVFVVD